MSNNFANYWIPGLDNNKSEPKEKIYAEGLLSQNEAYNAALKAGNIQKQKLDLLEKDSSKLLTNDGRELLI